jgi:Glycosyltransferase family 87
VQPRTGAKQRLDKQLTEILRAMSEQAAPYRMNFQSQAIKPGLAVTVVSLIIGLCGCIWFGPLCVEAMRPVDGRLNDYYQDWGSARNYLVGLPVYAEHANSIPRHLGWPASPSKSIDYNAHPPTSVLLALPFARFSYPDAVLGWNALSLVAFLASLVIVARVLSIPTTLQLPILALLVFCHPLYGNLYTTQLTLILVVFVTGIWALERSDKSYAAGLLIGAAATIKLFPAYLVVYYAARRQIRPIQAAVLSFTVLTLITVLVLGFDTYEDYVRVVLPHQTKFRSFGYNLSLAGFWHKLFDPQGERGWMTPLWFSPILARLGTMLSDLVVTLLVSVVAYRARTLSQRDSALATTVTAMLLVSPVTWDISLPLLLVPIAVIARTAKSSRGLAIALVSILGIISVPQIALTKLALGGRSLSVAPWTFMVGAPSIKFYALVATLGLGLVTFPTARVDAQQTTLEGELSS